MMYLWMCHEFFKNKDENKKESKKCEIIQNQMKLQHVAFQKKLFEKNKKNGKRSNNIIPSKFSFSIFFFFLNLNSTI